MTPATPRPTPNIRRGSIYRDVYEKRADSRPATATADLACAVIDGDRLHFIDRQTQERAMSDGVFFLRIPVDLDVSDADVFSHQFYLGSSVSPYGNFRELKAKYFGDSLLGFHQRVDQIEQFLLERRFWQRDYPDEITKIGGTLVSLSEQVLRSVLEYVGVPPQHWQRVTGGCSESLGSYHLTFNHYRHNSQKIGLSAHKDDGFLTLLRTVMPGLEVNRNQAWEVVPARPDHFIVNFGLSMEILTAGCDRPVSAIMHRVARQSRNRSSFGLFASSSCLPGTDAGIYQYSPGNGLELVCDSRKLIEENDHEIYEGTTMPEGGKQ